MKIYDYICLGFCCFHILFVIIEFVRGKILGKKIEKLCEKCGSFIFAGEDHICATVLDSAGNLRCFTESMLREYADLLNKAFWSNSDGN